MLQKEFQPTRFINAGGLTFATDEKIRALQAADLISWSVRRKITADFNHGFETLVDVFTEPHIQQPFQPEWMEEIGSNIRAKRANR